MSKYPVTDILFNREDLEQLGTKEKFWFKFAGSEQKLLFKFSRENTGEHWSEKAAQEIATYLRIPCVEYALATCNERLGIATGNIVPDSWRMIMGNEILHNHSSSEYPQPLGPGDRFVRVREHTIVRIMACLDKVEVLPGLLESGADLNAKEVFCGYLMLDALISNQDRHHENWAVLSDVSEGKLYLCPSYDHAASLGRELLDSDRQERLTTKDKNRTVAAFVRKAKSELFRTKSERLSTIDAFFVSVEKLPKAKDYWLGKLRTLNDKSIEYIFSRFGEEIISNVAREFAIRMIIENRERLLNDERV